MAEAAEQLLPSETDDAPAQAEAARGVAAQRVAGRVRRSAPGTETTPAHDDIAIDDTLLPSDREQAASGDVDLAERARLNFTHSYYRGTVLGSSRLAALAHFVTTPDDDHPAPEMKQAREGARTEYQRVVADLARYDLMRPWGSTTEAAVAFGGQLGGTMLSPESMAGWAASGASVLARTVKAGFQQGSIQAVVDPIVQWINRQGGTEHEYDWKRTGAAFGMGAIVGGGMHGIGELISNIGLKRIHADLAKDDPQFKSAGTQAFEQQRAGEIPEALPSDRGEVAEPSTPQAGAVPQTGAAPQAGAALHPDTTPIIRTGDVPYGAGVVLKDGKPVGVAVDRRVPSQETIDGVSFDPAEPVRIHELSEYQEMERLIGEGMSDHDAYLKAHTETATPAEKAWVEQLAKDNGKDPEAFWKAYQERWDGWLSHIEHETPEHPPEGLYTKPYPHREAEFLQRRESGAAEPSAPAQPSAAQSPKPAAPIESTVLAARASGGTLPMERARPSEGISTVDVMTGRETVPGRELATVPQVPSPERTMAVQSLQQQAVALADAIGFPLRQGRVKGGPGTLGTFNTGTGVVRVREVPDFEVVAHEAGHALEVKIGSRLTDLTNQFGNELAPLVSNPQAYDPSLWVKEGFAEFIRRYLGNPAHAQQVAPGFTNAFRATMRDIAPDIMNSLDAASAAYRGYLNAPSVDAVGSVVRSLSDRPEGWHAVTERIKADGFFPSVNRMMAAAYDATLDRFAPVPRAMRAVADAIRQSEGTALVELKAVDNPEFRLRMLGRSQQAAVLDAMKGVVPHNAVHHEGPSLSEAMAKAMGDDSAWGRWQEDKRAAFNSYLIARRADVLWQKFERGDLPRPPAAFSKGDATTAMADFERAHPTFREASDMVHGYTRQLLRKMHEAGLIDEQLAVKLMAEPFYVPFMRDRGDLPMAGHGQTGSSADGPGMTKVIARQQGSSRDIIDPIESILTQTFLVNRTIRHNDVIKAFVNYFGRAGAEGGRYVEKISAMESRKYTFDLGQAIEKKAIESGMTGDDAKVLTGMMADLTGEDPLMGSFFKMEPASKRGEPIVFYKEQGQLKAARFASESEGHALYELVTALPSGLSDMATQMLATSAGILRSGITTNPVFMLTNFIRDQVAAGILRSDYIPFYHGLKGIADELRQGASAELYGYAGGVAAGAHIAPLEQAGTMSVDALKRSGYLSHRLQDLHGLLELASVSEAGTRNSIFKTVYEQKRGQGLSDYEAMWEAAYAAQDILDFSRWGSKTEAVRALTPFFNAHLQGLDKARRTMFDPILRRAQGGELFAADKEAYSNALLAWGKMLGVGGVLGAAWAAIHHDDRHYRDAPPELIGTHFVTSINGKYVVIPKPFELGLGFTAGEYAYKRLMQEDPRAALHFVDAAYEVIKPPVPIFDNPMIKTTYELATGKSTYPNFWAGRDIVPDTLKGLIPAEQYTDRTSNLAKQIGKAIGVSPMKVDFALGGYFGLWGRDAMALSNALEEDRPVANWTDHVFARRFIKDPTRSSDVTTRFWNFMGRTTGAFNQAVNQYDEYVKRRSPAADAEATQYLQSLPGNQRAYVMLKSGADDNGKAAFKSDEKRLHPLQRAYDAVTLLNGIRREMDKNSFAPFATGAGIKLDQETRGNIRDNVRELAQMEMYNALTVVKAPGYDGRGLLDIHPTLEKIRKLSPAVAEEIATRYATAKIYTTQAVVAAYPHLMDRLLRDGSDADIGDLAFDAKGDGPEFSGERVKKPMKLRMPIRPQQAMPAPAPAQ